MITAFLRNFIRAVFAAVLRVTPTWRHCVVSGFPDAEGNAVEVVRYLARHYDGRIIWLVVLAKNELQWQLRDLADVEVRKVQFLSKWSWRGLFLFFTAEAVFFTHGLYSSPVPGRRRTFVNLWHGDGPKEAGNRKYRTVVNASFLVSGTRLWGEYKGRFFGQKARTVLIVGNPRIDQFARPATDSDLSRLGLRPGGRILLWVPTFRTCHPSIDAAWRDAEMLSRQDRTKVMVRWLAQHARQHSIEVVIKPHPMDKDRFEESGCIIIRDSDLSRGEVEFYRFLARCHALLTDYSSIWTDYLALDRPIGFYCPDLGDYERNRGFNVPNFAKVLPGPLIRDESGMQQFLDDVLTDGTTTKSLRASIAGQIGATLQLGATARLFEELDIARGNAGLRTLVRRGDCSRGAYQIS